jgi:predicted permease
MVRDIKTILKPILSNSPAFSAAGKAMGELITAGCIGTVCVETEYLTPTMVQNLSKTTFSILLPMFLFTSITRSIQKFGLTGNSLLIPLLAIAHAFTQCMISKYILMPIFGLDGDTDENRATVISSTFGNAGVVPLIFAEALFRNDDTSLIAKAHSYISLYLLGWSPFFWSFGKRVLVGRPNTSQVSRKQSFANMKSLIPPPVAGVIVGIIISLFPSLRNVFMNTPEHRAPLNVVFNSIENFGKAANPSSLLVLTASLALGTSSTSTTDSVSLEEDGGANFMHRYLCVSIARFIVSPLLMYCMLKTLTKLGIMESSKTNPMLWFILLLQSSMPSAQNSVLMLQAAEKGGAATRLAKFLFSIYATSMVPLVFLSTILLDKFQMMT